MGKKQRALLQELDTTNPRTARQVSERLAKEGWRVTPHGVGIRLSKMEKDVIRIRGKSPIDPNRYLRRRKL